MTPFGPDPQPLCPDEGSRVTGVTDPAGTIGFSQEVGHDQATGPCWATWSHGYTGDVYDTLSSLDPTSPTISLPAGTRAFYLYAEPNVFDVFDVQATAQTERPPGGARARQLRSTVLRFLRYGHAGPGVDHRDDDNGRGRLRGRRVRHLRVGAANPPN